MSLLLFHHLLLIFKPLFKQPIPPVDLLDDYVVYEESCNKVDRVRQELLYFDSREIVFLES